MRKNIIKLYKLAPALMLSPLAMAQTVPAIETAAITPEAVFSNPAIPLNAKEKKALEIVEAWKKNPDKPVRAKDGSVKYLFGATLPTLVCSIGQVCSIRLQEGEKIIGDPAIGDDVRWKIFGSIVGSGHKETVNIIVKPLEAGLKTNLILSTDRRKYTVKLVSTLRDWMPELAFEYSDEADQAWAAFRARQAKAVHASTLPTGENIANLDFNFRMSGDDPKWKPVRIYTDGVKTYIQFASSRFADEAPALVALGKDGGFFSEPTEQLVNYRLVGDRYVVDAKLDRAALVSGVGRQQTRVTIEYEGEK